MSDGSAEAPMWMPRWDGMPAGARRVLVWLILWRDGRGSCDPTNEELAHVTGLDVATIRRHTGWLEREGWARRERRRRPDNSLGGWRYWLDLEKLGLAGSEGANCAVAPPVDSPATPDQENRGSTAQGTAQNARSVGEKVDEGPRKMRGLIEPGARAGARLSLYSISPSFAFRDDVQKQIMERIIAACGVGLCDPEQCEGLSESLAEALDDMDGEAGWLTRFDLEADIVPAIRKLTANKRPKPVYDFRLFDRPGDSDLQKWRDARLDKEARKAAKLAKDEAGAKPRAAGGFVAPVRSDEQARAAKMLGLRNVIRAIDAGAGQTWMLPKDKQRETGEWLDDAYADARRVAAAELAQLESVQHADETARTGAGL